MWALQHIADAKKTTTTWTQVLKYLAMQALQRNGETISKSLSSEFNSLTVASANGDEKWEAILVRALAMDTAYLIVDLAVLDSLKALQLETMLSSIRRLILLSNGSNKTVKVAILASTKLQTPSLLDFHKLEMDYFVRTSRRSRKTALNRRTNVLKGRIPLRIRGGRGL